MSATVTLPGCCPTCGHVIDAATGIIEDARPAAGDFSVCWSCGELLRFLEDLTVARAETEELGQLDVTNRRALLWAQKGIRRRGPPAPEGGQRSMSPAAREIEAVEAILTELLVELDEVDGRAIWEACDCGGGAEACAGCLRDGVRRKADDARLRLDKLRHGDVAA